MNVMFIIIMFFFGFKNGCSSSFFYLCASSIPSSYCNFSLVSSSVQNTIQYTKHVSLVIILYFLSFQILFFFQSWKNKDVVVVSVVYMETLENKFVPCLLCVCVCECIRAFLTHLTLYCTPCILKMVLGTHTQD